MRVGSECVRVRCLPVCHGGVPCAADSESGGGPLQQEASLSKMSGKIGHFYSASET